MSGEGATLLTYRTLGLGDLLTAIPALRALRRRFPRHHHVLATPPWLGPIVAAIDAVDEHLPLHELAAVPGQLHRAAVAVNLHGSGPESHRVLAATEPARLIAFHHPALPATSGAPRWRDDEHEVARWCRLLEEHGIEADRDDLGLEPPAGPTPQVPADATIIHPGAKAASRRWPVDRFAAVARHEAARGRPVVLTGSEDERPLAGQVAAAADLPAGSILAGRTDLGALCRVVAGAGRVLSGDTGVAHVATAVGTPSVTLFGPTAPSEWGPPTGRARHTVLWKGATGDPLGDRPDPGLLRITVGEVCDALDALAASTRGAMGPSSRR